MTPPPFGNDVASLVEVARVRATDASDGRGYVFLEDGETSVTNLGFAELDRRAASMAAHLQSVARPSERWVLALPPGPDYIVSFWACLYAGIWAVPLYPPLNPKYVTRMLAVMRDCDAKGIITLSAIAGPLEAWLEEQGVRPGTFAWVTTDTLPETPASALRPPTLAPSDIAFLQYTSGSTGHPRGVMISHENLLANSAGLETSYRRVHESAGSSGPIVNVSWLPPYHDAGLTDGLLQTVYAGKTTVLMSPLSFLEKPVRWLRAISRYRATASGGPSFGYEYCAKRVSDEDASGLDLSSWICSVNGAEPVRRDVFEAFAARFSRIGYDPRGLTPTYGLAEGTLLASVETRWGDAYWREVDRQKLEAHVATAPKAGARSVSLASHGRPLDGAEVKIVDPDSRIERGPSEVGEIWLSGKSVSRGYWGKPELSDATFRAHTVETSTTAAAGPFLRTGDFGFLAEDGALFVTGRIKDVIVVRGKKHYPQDIEATVAASHPCFRNGGTAAFSFAAEGGESFVVMQEMRPGQDEATMRSALAAANEAVVGAHGIAPFDVVLAPPNGVPKTSSGKIERFKAREQYREGSLPALLSLRTSAPDASGAAIAKTKRTIERTMLAWIANEADLDIQTIDKDAAFDSFGIDSVRVVELMTEVETKLEIAVPDRAVLECKTIAQMSSFLAELATNGERTTAKDRRGLETRDAHGHDRSRFVLPKL